MSVTGAFAELRRMASRFRQVGAVLPRIVRDMGGEALRLNRASASAQQTPNGSGWRAGPSVSSPMLRKSGKLLGSMRQATDGGAFGTRVSPRYAWYHQSGAHLRDSIKGSAGKLRTSSSGPGRGKSGPRSRVRQQGPKRKGRLRGFLPARQILPRPNELPARWAPFLSRIADRQVERALGF